MAVSGSKYTAARQKWGNDSTKWPKNWQKLIGGSSESGGGGSNPPSASSPSATVKSIHKKNAKVKTTKKAAKTLAQKYKKVNALAHTALKGAKTSAKERKAILGARKKLKGMRTKLAKQGYGSVEVRADGSTVGHGIQKDLNRVAKGGQPKQHEGQNSASASPKRTGGRGQNPVQKQAAGASSAAKPRPAKRPTKNPQGYTGQATAFKGQKVGNASSKPGPQVPKPTGGPAYSNVGQAIIGGVVAAVKDTHEANRTYKAPLKTRPGVTAVAKGEGWSPNGMKTDKATRPAVSQSKTPASKTSQPKPKPAAKQPSVKKRKGAGGRRVN